MTQATEAPTGKDRFVSTFEAREPEWSRNGQSWLAPVRRAAIERFRAIGFPSRRHEQWRHTNLRPIEKIAFSTNPSHIDPQSVAGRLDAFGFEGLDCHRLVFLNGQFQPDLSSVGNLPDGVKIRGLREAISEEVEALRPHLARHADFDEHPFVALNTALIDDGAFIHVAKGACVDRPVHLLYLTDPAHGDLATHPRNLVVVEETAELKVIESFESLGREVYLTNAVTEIAGGAGSNIQHYKFQRESFESFHIATVSVRLERDASFASHLMSYGGRIARNETAVCLDGEGIHCTLNGLYVVDGERHVDHHTRLDHAKPNCDSFQIYKGIADERASGVFNGRILVREDAQKTDAKQSSMNLVLSETASVDAEPQLEIYADDVKCTHGATIGRLDEESLFYLRSRGIDAKMARTILTIAFANEVLDKMQLEPVRDRCARLVFDHFQSQDDK